MSSRVKAGRAAAVRVTMEEERLPLLENPEELSSNDMLSRSSELSCQKKAPQWRKPSEQGKARGRQQPWFLIYLCILQSIRVHNAGKPRFALQKEV